MPVNIFISHNVEDGDFAAGLESVLSRLFGGAVKITRMGTLEPGKSWSAAIENGLDSAHILLALACGRQKAEFSYAGAEVGYFRRLMKERGGNEGPAVKRVLIPFFIVPEMPAILSDIQGVNLEAARIGLDGIDLEEDVEVIIDRMVIDRSNPILHFLTIIENASAPDAEITDDRKEALKTHTKEIYRKTIEAVRKTKRHTDERPKGKIVISVPANRIDANDDRILELLNFELHGPLNEIFSYKGGSDWSPKWSEISAELPNDGARDEWKEIIKGLVDCSRRSIFDQKDHLLFSAGGEKLYRIFITNSEFFWSGERRIHAYIVEVLQEEEYGEEYTTVLIKGIRACARFRFIFLEDKKKFQPIVISMQRDIFNLKKVALELSRELNYVESLWRDARLQNPAYIMKIWGVDGGKADHRRRSPAQISAMLANWESCKNALTNSIHKVLALPTVVKFEDPEYAAAQKALADAISRFQKTTREDNEDFLINLLTELLKKVSDQHADISAKASGPLSMPT